MSSLREAWLCVLQDEDGAEETELVTIEWDGDRPPVIDLTSGLRIKCLEPLTRTAPKA